jgi:hypothetical protein
MAVLNGCGRGDRDLRLRKLRAVDGVEGDTSAQKVGAERAVGGGVWGAGRQTGGSRSTRHRHARGHRCSGWTGYGLLPFR